MKIKKALVKGLFGYVDHEINIGGDSVVVLTAPNGAGKTHALKIIDSVVNYHLYSLSRIDFKTCEIVFDTGKYFPREISVTALKNHKKIELIANYNRVTKLIAQIDYSIEGPKDMIPRGVRILGDGTYINIGTRAVLGESDVFDLYSKEKIIDSINEIVLQEKLSSFERLLENKSKFIDTKRIDLDEGSRIAPLRGTSGIRHKSQSKIYKYLTDFKNSIETARAKSNTIARKQDSVFFESLLNNARSTVRPAELKEKYDKLIEITNNLSENGLVERNAIAELPEDQNPTVRRILDLYLENQEERLKPLIEINEKINLLKNILNSKLETSGKKVVLNENDHLEFRTLDDRKLNIANLSSGELHLVSIFLLVLFDSKENQIILIDEPEISMHASWKIEFLRDIIEISKNKNLQFIIATHSITLISGRWDITRELELQIPDNDISDVLEDEEDIIGDLFSDELER